MTHSQIKNKFTALQIDTFNANAKSQGAENFDATIQTALDYETKSGLKNKALKIVTFAMDSTTPKTESTKPALFTTEEEEDCRRYK